MPSEEAATSAAAAAETGPQGARLLQHLLGCLRAGPHLCAHGEAK